MKWHHMRGTHTERERRYGKKGERELERGKVDEKERESYNPISVFTMSLPTYPVSVKFGEVEIDIVRLRLSLADL